MEVILMFDFVNVAGYGLVGGESYPQRPDEADCIYYLRTGFCGYGSRCRFNHPRDRGAVKFWFLFLFLFLFLEVFVSRVLFLSSFSM